MDTMAGQAEGEQFQHLLSVDKHINCSKDHNDSTINLTNSTQTSWRSTGQGGPDGVGEEGMANLAKVRVGKRMGIMKHKEACGW